MNDEIAALDTAALKRLADQLRADLRTVEAELWRRTATQLAELPPAWADPSTAGLVLDAAQAEDYIERAHECLRRELPPTCRPGRAYPWTEIWGPRGALGPNAVHRMRQLIADAHEQARGEAADPEPWS